MRRHIVVGDLEVDRKLWLERESVEIRPGIVAKRLQHPLSRVLDQTIRPGELPRLLPIPEPDGKKQTGRAEADVSQPFGVFARDLEHHMRSRQDPRRAEAYTRGEQCHLEPEGTQRGGEQRVLLEAIAAAPAVHELGLQAGKIDADRPAEEDIQILERDVRRMRDMQSTERRERGLARALIGDARKIGFEIECVGGHWWAPTLAASFINSAAALPPKRGRPRRETARRRLSAQPESPEAHREEDFAQEQRETHDERAHRQDEEHRDHLRELDGEQCADKGKRHHQADQQRRRDGGQDREIDEPRALHQTRKLSARLRSIAPAGVLQPFLHDAAAIDGAPEPVVERGDQGADRGEQEHRRDGKLDGAGNVGDMSFHRRGSGGAASGPSVERDRLSLVRRASIASSPGNECGRHPFRERLLARLIGGGCRWDGLGSRRSGRALLAQPFLLFLLLLGQISLAFGEGVVGFGQLAVLVGG